MTILKSLQFLIDRYGVTFDQQKINFLQALAQRLPNEDPCLDTSDGTRLDLLWADVDDNNRFAIVINEYNDVSFSGVSEQFSYFESHEYEQALNAILKLERFNKN